MRELGTGRSAKEDPARLGSFDRKSFQQIHQETKTGPSLGCQTAGKCKYTSTSFIDEKDKKDGNDNKDDSDN